MSRSLRFNRVLASKGRIALILAVVNVLSGCYLMQAARGQLAISSSRQPLEDVIKAPTTPRELRDRLQLIAQARSFASSELGLPDNDSYRSFADLNRDFAVWNVFATDRYSVEPRTWCFPIAGCVVYRGYFDPAAAERYARGVRLNGGDAAVGGVAAYSTLGHFDDPVLSTMLRWSDTQIVATLFHELAHQVFYAAGESGFNEAFASVVEEEGTKRWLAQRGDATAFSSWQTSRARGSEFTALLLATRERLRDLYANNEPSLDLYFRKQQEFGRLKFEYTQLKARWNGYAGYDAWFDRALNNAHLVSAATYDACIPQLQALLADGNNDLPKFYETVKALSEKERRVMCSEE